jgi:hypothetical protein
MPRIHLVLAAFLALSTALPVSAEEFSGAAVYPGAKRDAVADAYCKAYDPAGNASRCFRTSDSFDKVMQFYAKQPKLKQPRFGAMKIPGANVGLFCPKAQDECTLTTMKGLQVVLQNPWTAETEKPVKVENYENKDVLIRIVNKDKLYEALNKQAR